MLATACLLGGCARDGIDATSNAELVSEVVSGPVTLRVESDRESLRTVDRTQVRVRVMLEGGATLSELTFETADSDWTVIDDRAEPVRSLGDGRALHARTLTLEPFLDGEYTIPSVSASWTQGEVSGVAVSEPLVVTVSSVLDEGDPLEIGVLRETPAALEAPAVESDQRFTARQKRRMVILGLVAIGGVITFVQWLRRKLDRTGRDAVKRLELAVGQTGKIPAACAEAAAALRRLDDPSREDVRQLIDALDDARFARDDVEDARALVLIALERVRRVTEQQRASA